MRAIVGQDWLLWSVMAGTWLAAVAVLVWVNPAEVRWIPPCPFRWATGLLCPGCGSLRATHALLHGDFLTAWRLNPLLILMLPAVAGMLGWSLYLRRRGRREHPGSFVPAAVLYFLAAMVGVYWVGRNLF